MVGLADMQTELRKLQGTFFCPKIPSRWPQVNPFFSLMLASFRTASKKQHSKIFELFFIIMLGSGRRSSVFFHTAPSEKQLELYIKPLKKVIYVRFMWGFHGGCGILKLFPSICPFNIS